MLTSGRTAQPLVLTLKPRRPRRRRFSNPYKRLGLTSKQELIIKYFLKPRLEASGGAPVSFCWKRDVLPLKNHPKRSHLYFSERTWERFKALLRSRPDLAEALDLVISVQGKDTSSSSFFEWTTTFTTITYVQRRSDTDGLNLQFRSNGKLRHVRASLKSQDHPISPNAAAWHERHFSSPSRAPVTANYALTTVPRFTRQTEKVFQQSQKKENRAFGIKEQVTDSPPERDSSPNARSTPQNPPWKPRVSRKQLRLAGHLANQFLVGISSYSSIHRDAQTQGRLTGWIARRLVAFEDAEALSIRLEEAGREAHRRTEKFSSPVDISYVWNLYFIHGPDESPEHNYRIYQAMNAIDLEPEWMPMARELIAEINSDTGSDALILGHYLRLTERDDFMFVLKHLAKHLDRTQRKRIHRLLARERTQSARLRRHFNAIRNQPKPKQGHLALCS